MIWDIIVHPGSGFFSPILDHGSGSRIQGSKITGSGSATLKELELKLSKLKADSDPEAQGTVQYGNAVQNSL